MHKKQTEIRVIFILITTMFLIFLGYPILQVIITSMKTETGFGFSEYVSVFSNPGFAAALRNSFLIAGASALVTTFIGFILAYTINLTIIPSWMKKLITAVALLPMLLPTITYGFAIVYSFGKQGLITKILGKQLFNIYGFNGLLLGYVIYTLPVAFMLINNTFRYIDKKFIIVSRVMGDSTLQTFLTAVFRPLMGTLAAAFIQTFFLCFTDYGIPASVGGEFQVVATSLYNEMLGALPNFSGGAVIAIAMLAPSAFSIIILTYLERYNIRYHKISTIDLEENDLRDNCFQGISLLICICVLSIFAVIFVIPFVKEWPYDNSFSLTKIADTMKSSNMGTVYQNSIFVAVMTAVVGTLAAYGGALVSGRSKLSARAKSVVDGIALVTNTIPGMVLGIAFLFSFAGTPVQNTYFILIICNVVHFFSTPYLMMKSSLEKMNSSWETTAMLMGDSWFKTIVRVVTPNAGSTILEVFAYYFINSMVTISAVIFIAGARTMVITTKIKELQHFTKFDQIFVLSLCILVTNLTAKGLLKLLQIRNQKKV